MPKDSTRAPGALTLVGSGEMSPSMGKVHRAVMSRIVGPVRAVFLDTPAGFELNADQISANAVQYFERHLDLNLSVASFKTAASPAPGKVEGALRKLGQANYIFAGPGSPTYAIRTWRGTALWETVARRLAAGAHLVFASAAAIAVSRYALPVYEIYKVGEDPRWVDGLDLLGPYGLELAIVPHWNNAEGGAHDTRYCFLGEPRMRFLERHLPGSAVILGIDEYTACTIDIARGECLVMGAGQATVRRGGYAERTYPAGACFALDELRAPDGGALSPAATSAPMPGWIDWPDEADDGDDSVAPLIALLVRVRARLRAAGQWALADEIRRGLSEMGVILEDGPTETTWRRT